MLFHLHRHWLVVFLGNMRLPIILFLSTLSLCSVSEGRPDRLVVFTKANKDSYVELFPQHTMALKAFTLCMRFGSTLPVKDTILFEYRTSRRDELSIWHLKTGGYGVYVGGKRAVFKVPDMTSLLSHMCVVWDSNTGLTYLYWNGHRTMMAELQRGYTLQTPGRVILGQDADSYLGKFDQRQSFVGEITDVNMWDHVDALGDNVGLGNLINWETVKLQAKGKHVLVVDKAPVHVKYLIHK